MNWGSEVEQLAGQRHLLCAQVSLTGLFAHNPVDKIWPEHLEGNLLIFFSRSLQ